MGDSPRDAGRLHAMLRAIRAAGPPPEPGPDCLDEDALAALADGGLEPARREYALRHLALCAYCRGAVASVAEALDDPEVAGARTAAERPPRRRLARFAVPAAAAAILLVALLGRRDLAVPDLPVHRAPAATTAAQPLALAPVGPVARPESLRWQSVAGADLYRVTLYRSDGAVLLSREVRDTTTVLPPAIPMIAGQSYLWMVEARTGWNRWSGSRLFEFSVAGDPGR